MKNGGRGQGKREGIKWSYERKQWKVVERKNERREVNGEREEKKNGKKWIRGKAEKKKTGGEGLGKMGKK